MSFSALLPKLAPGVTHHPRENRPGQEPLYPRIAKHFEDPRLCRARDKRPQDGAGDHVNQQPDHDTDRRRNQPVNYRPDPLPHSPATRVSLASRFAKENGPKHWCRTVAAAPAPPRQGNSWRNLASRASVGLRRNELMTNV